MDRPGGTHGAGRGRLLGGRGLLRPRRTGAQAALLGIVVGLAGLSQTSVAPSRARPLQVVDITAVAIGIGTPILNGATAPGTDITATLTRRDGSVFDAKATSGADGSFEIFFEDWYMSQWRQHTIEASDVVMITPRDGESLIQSVPQLTAVLGPGATELEGHGPALSELTVETWNFDLRLNAKRLDVRTVRAEASGHYMTDYFTTALPPVQPGDTRYGRVVYAANTRVTIFRPWSNPTLKVGNRGDLVQSVGAPLESISTTVRASNGQVIARSQQNTVGYTVEAPVVVQDLTGARHAIHSGETVVIERGSAVRTLKIPRLDGIIDGKTVFGIAEPGASIRLYRNDAENPRDERTVVADAAGQFQTSLEGTDLTPIEAVTMEAILPGLVYMNVALPVSFEVNYAFGTVTGDAPVASNVTVTLEDNAGHRSTMPAQLNALGQFTARIPNMTSPDGGSLELTVSTEYHTLTKRISLPALTIHLDPANQRITGRISEGYPHFVLQPWSPDAELGRLAYPKLQQLTVGANGAYTATMSADALRPGMWVNVSSEVPGAGRIANQDAVPVLAVQAQGGCVSGVVRPGEPVQVTFSRIDGTPIRSGTVASTPEGTFVIQLPPPGGGSYPAPDTMVTLTTPSTTLSTNVIGLAADVNWDDGSFTGHTLPKAWMSTKTPAILCGESEFVPGVYVSGMRSKEDGSFSVHVLPVQGSPFESLRNGGISATVRDDLGMLHRFVALPLGLHVFIHENRVEISGSPGETAVGAVMRGGNVAGSLRASLDEHGRAAVNAAGVSSNEFAFRPGDDVMVRTESGVAQLDVDALSLDLLGDHRVLVVAEPNQTLELHFEQTGAPDIIWPVTLDSRGRLVQDLADKDGPFIDLTKLHAMSAWIKHGYEHRVIARLIWPESSLASAVYLPMSLRNR
jgi:hypothetical protein